MVEDSNLQPSEEELQKQLINAAVLVAKTVRFFISGGLSKIGSLVWNALAGLALHGLSFGSLHTPPSPSKKKIALSFWQKNKTGLHLLVLILITLLLPLIFIFLNLSTAETGLITEPLAPIK